MSLQVQLEIALERVVELNLRNNELSLENHRLRAQISGLSKKLNRRRGGGVITISRSAEKDLGLAAGQAGQAMAGAAGALARKAGRTAARQAGRGLKHLARALLSFLGPYLWIAIIVVVVLLLISTLTLGMFGAMTEGDTQTGLFTGVNESAADPAIQAAYQELADRVNGENLSQVAVSSNWMIVAGGQQPSFPEAPLYPGAGGGARLPAGARSYYQQERYLPWGVIHSVRLWWAYAKNDDTLLENMANMEGGLDFDSIEQGIPQEVRATRVASDLRPYFYYVPATFVTRYIPSPDAQDARPSTEVENVYLLVEQYTIYGWEQYSYRQVHEDKTNPNGSRVIRDYCAQNGSRLIAPDQYRRIRTYLNNLYGMEPGDPQSDLLRLSVLEAGEGFAEHEQRFEWLIANYDPYVFASSAMVPAELRPYFQEASQRFGIPVWFLEAVAARESSFDSAADNGESGHLNCFGLMQVNIDNWNEYAPQLGLNPALDKNNPRAQVLVGAFLLESFLGVVDWNASDWQERTLYGLAYYGGFRGPSGQIDQDAMERCRAGYAGDIWRLAEGFRDHGGYYWPVQGDHVVTDAFNVTDPSRAIHHGVDIAAPEGQPVYSVSSGYVQEIGSGDPVYGNYVVVSDAVHTYKYAHFGSVSVQQNQSVEAGATVLGEVGMTGETTGPHVHLEIKNLATGSYVNPLDIIGYDCAILD
jgi:murein DD-endopeptidase MepM/ murein hydrolase activator NlpD